MTSDESKTSGVAARGAADDRPRMLAGCLSGAPDCPVSVGEVRACLKDPRPEIRVLAVEALVKFGGEGVPGLIEALDSSQPVPVRIGAASALGRIGPEGAAATEPLAGCLSSEDDLLRWHASYALGKIGPEAVPAIDSAIGSKDERTAAAAVDALGSIRPEAGGIRSRLEELGGHISPLVRLSALSALVKIGGGASPALAQMESVLREGGAQPREECAKRAGLLGQAAVDLLPALLACLEDESPKVRAQAVLALARITCGLPDAGVLEALERMLGDKDPEVCANAAVGLSAFGPAASHALPALKAMENGEDPALAAIAGAAAKKIG